MGIHSDACLTAAELAQRLRVTTPTVLRWHRAGKIPAFRPVPHAPGERSYSHGEAVPVF